MSGVLGFNCVIRELRGNYCESADVAVCDLTAEVECQWKKGLQVVL